MDFDRTYALINLADETGELTWNRWAYTPDDYIDKPVRKILFKGGASRRYMPFENGVFAGTMWLLVTNERARYKKRNPDSDDEIYEIYREGEEPYLISDLWDTVHSKKIVFLSKNFDELRVEYGKRIPLNKTTGIPLQERYIENGAFLRGLDDSDGNGCVRIGGEDSVICDADVYPFNTLFSEARAVKCKSEDRKHLGELVYKIFDVDLTTTFKTDRENIVVDKLDDVPREIIESNGVWFLGNEEGLDEISKNRDGDYVINGNEYIDYNDIELGDPVEFTWVKVYTDEKSVRHFVAKDTYNRWYTDEFTLLKPINITLIENGKFVKHTSFEDCISIHEITKDYDGFDDYTKNRSPRFIWLKLGNDWYGNTNFKFEKETNEKMLGVLETISRGRNEKQNMLSSLKRIGKEIKI